MTRASIGRSWSGSRSVLFEGTHLGRDAAEIAVLAMIQAQAAGQVSMSVDPDRLGRAIYSNYLGAIYDWACGRRQRRGLPGDQRDGRAGRWQPPAPPIRPDPPWRRG